MMIETQYEKAVNNLELRLAEACATAAGYQLALEAANSRIAVLERELKDASKAKERKRA